MAARSRRFPAGGRQSGSEQAERGVRRRLDHGPCHSCDTSSSRFEIPRCGPGCNRHSYRPRTASTSIGVEVSSLCRGRESGDERCVARWRAPRLGISWKKLIRITRATPCVVLTTINPAADSLSHRPVATSINADIRALAARTLRSTKWPIGVVLEPPHQQFEGVSPARAHSDSPDTGWGGQAATLDQNALAKCGSRTP